MKFFKNPWSNIIIAVIILVLIIPGTRKPIQIFLNKVLSFSPSVTSEEDRMSIASYEWSLEKNNRDRENLSEYKGEVVLINFWATWCPPCRAEMPQLVKMQREYGSQGLQGIGITYPPQTLKEVLRFTRSLQVNYPTALGTKETMLLFDQSETLPVTIVIDRDGKIRDRIEGILLPEEFEQKIKPLLKQQ